mmetsp:Transcript_8828/g.54355  ORF Transcript_8828/g.54355 Transcript_8828/m.54355 type:complete len:111 (-) Transcript_8828:538-870(-)
MGPLDAVAPRNVLFSIARLVSIDPLKSMVQTAILLGKSMVLPPTLWICSSECVDQTLTQLDSFNSCSTRVVATGSRELVGSSSRITSGWKAKAIASAILWYSPPERLFQV